MPTIALRDYQEKLVADVRAEFRARNLQVLLVLPTGGGKTYTFSYIAANAAEKGNSVIIIVHRKELLLQASASLRNLGIPHGLISPHFTPDPYQLVQVASIDTLLIRLQDPRFKQRFQLVIFDEAHHVLAGNKWGRVYDLLGAPPMLGVTATPVRTDGKGLGDHAGGLFRAMVLGPTIGELIERGSLVNPVVYSSLDMPDLAGIKKTKDGDYNRNELAAATDKPVITGSAVAHYQKICPGARAIVFCASVKHARNVAAEFNAAGYKFELLVGAPEMSDAERTAVNARLRSGEIHGACTVDLVSEGYDLPDLECCIMLRATASESLFLQQAGRIMRPSDNKRGCWLLDHVGNVGRVVEGEYKPKHGLPDQYREWTLDGRKKGKGAKKDEPVVPLKQCPQCFMVSEPADCCPTCGFEFPAPAVRELRQVEGELSQVTAEMAAAMRKTQRVEQGKAQSVQDMVQKLGYSRGRAEKIAAARAEKAALRDGLMADLKAWQARTGRSVRDTFGMPMSSIGFLKPKELRELRAKFDSLNAVSTIAGDGEAFANFMRRTLQKQSELAELNT